MRYARFCQWLTVGLAAMVTGTGCSDGSDLVGNDDAVAAAACAAFGSDDHALTAAESSEEAASAPLDEDGETYVVTLPSSGTGYAQVNVPLEHHDLRVYTQPAEAVSALFDPEGELASQSYLGSNGACPDSGQGEHFSHLHEPGDYALELTGEPGGTVRVVVYVVASEHFDPDGGAHHDEDGGAHHDEDGGHHDEDGGHH